MENRTSRNSKTVTLAVETQENEEAGLELGKSNELGEMRPNSKVPPSE